MLVRETEEAIESGLKHRAAYCLNVLRWQDGAEDSSIDALNQTPLLPSAAPPAWRGVGFHSSALVMLHGGFQKRNG